MDQKPKSKRYSPSLATVFVLATGMAVGISGAIMPSYYLEGETLDRAIKENCIEKLAANAKPHQKADRITIEFSQQALDRCIQEGHDHHEASITGAEKIANIGMGVTALGLAFMGAGYLRHRKKLNHETGPKGPQF